MSIWEGGRYHEYGDLNISTPEAINLEVIGQYYKIPGVYDVFNEGGFIVDANGLLTYTGIYGIFLMNGISDAEVNKSSYVTYASYLNDELYSSTVHQFAASSKAEAISTTAIVKLSRNDTIEIYAKSDTANTLLTPTTLKVTFFGARR